MNFWEEWNMQDGFILHKHGVFEYKCHTRFRYQAWWKMGGSKSVEGVRVPRPDPAHEVTCDKCGAQPPEELLQFFKLAYHKDPDHAMEFYGHNWGA